MKKLPFRVGQGYDLHKLIVGRKLILGGIEIPFEKGLQGHSDADCLIHAICDAILGALSMNDIGHFFPDNDPSLEGISSMKILDSVLEKCTKKGYQVANLDVTVIAQRPKLQPYVKPIRENLSQQLQIDPDRIGIKATTNEKVGCIGREEAIATFAVCLLHSLE